MVLHPSDNYDTYIDRQKKKTLDQKRIEKWKGVEWQTKIEGFRLLFERHGDLINDSSSGLCLGSRTGQEVFVLREMGLECRGIDLVAFPPWTEEGDIHNLGFEDESFDLIFSNIFDHSIYPGVFISEMERVCKSGGHMILHLQIGVKGDEFSENLVREPKFVLDLFSRSDIFQKGHIWNTFDSLNYELVMRKTN